MFFSKKDEEKKEAAETDRREEALTAPQVPPNPVLVESYRSEILENIYRGSFAVADDSGALLSAWGDVETPVFFRTALNPLKVLALVETGAAEKRSLGQEEIALACGAHSGEPQHTERIKQWVHRLGYRANDMECGAVYPIHEATRQEIIREGVMPAPFHNPASGIHAAYLTIISYFGISVTDYCRPQHPAQVLFRDSLQKITRQKLSEANFGIDGSNVPAYAFSLREVAVAFARFGTSQNLKTQSAAAAETVREAMLSCPELVGGTERFDTEVMNTIGNVIVREGPEGTGVAALPDLGLGVALKIDDGSRRAKQIALLTLLAKTGVMTEADFAPLERWALEERTTDDGEVSLGFIQPEAEFAESELDLSETE